MVSWSRGVSRQNSLQDAKKSSSCVKRRSSLVTAKLRILTRYASRFTDLENAAGGLFPHPAMRTARRREIDQYKTMIWKGNVTERT